MCLVPLHSPHPLSSPSPQILLFGCWTSYLSSSPDPLDHLDHLTEEQTQEQQVTILQQVLNTQVIFGIIACLVPVHQYLSSNIPKLHDQMLGVRSTSDSCAGGDSVQETNESWLVQEGATVALLQMNGISAARSPRILSHILARILSPKLARLLSYN